MFRSSRTKLLHVAGGVALAAAAVLPLTVPSTAHAWWRYGWGPGIYVAPPVVIAPAPVYVGPPVYAGPAYAPGRVWIGPHWSGGYWVRGHWGWR